MSTSKPANYYYRSWLWQAPIGLSLVGFGACLIAEAAMLKYSGSFWWEWGVAGTVALCIFNSGLCIFGNAILHRFRYEKAMDL